jgi:dGTPase
MPETLSYNYCAQPLAAYACRPDMSRGRIFVEPESKHRTAFQRDRDRIIHASAFRRLKYKTQVFVYFEGDHYRTRLTHTLEVAQVARTLARALYLNEDLSESIALAHDLGHSPFAHKGEDVLAELMKNYGGFAHNDQTVRVLTELEHRYAAFRGLNLTLETLEGVIKHNGPALKKGETTDQLHFTQRNVAQQADFYLYDFAHLEAQVVDLADDIAYNNHDVEDGLRAGFFTLDDLAQLPIYADVLPDVRARVAGQDDHIVVFETIREQIGAMVDDVIMTTRANLARLKPQSPDDVRHAGMRIVAFSPAMFERVKELRTFLHARMYRHYTLNRIALKVDRIIGDLFKVLLESPKLLPDPWQDKMGLAAASGDKAAGARVIADYIAGMTDRYAIREHARLFDLNLDIK